MCGLVGLLKPSSSVTCRLFQLADAAAVSTCMVFAFCGGLREGRLLVGVGGMTDTDVVDGCD